MIRIGVTLSVESRGAFFEYCIPSDYVYAVISCGATPLLIPPLEDPGTLDRYLADVDGIIMTGGDDITPEVYGSENNGLSQNTSIVRDEAEIYLIRKALDLGYPVLGICRGFQLINAAFGGELYQDIETEYGVGVKHRNVFKSAENLHHEVSIEKGTMLHRIIGSEKFAVNSRHHQGIKTPGKGLSISAVAGDGIIEAVESAEMNIVAVQWHPENLVRLGGEYKALFADLVERCETFRNKKV